MKEGNNTVTKEGRWRKEDRKEGRRRKEDEEGRNIVTKEGR
jgi:hypothetical protein